MKQMELVPAAPHWYVTGSHGMTLLSFRVNHGEFGLLQTTCLQFALGLS